MQPITHGESQWRRLCETCRLDPEAATAGEVYIEIMRRGLGTADETQVAVVTADLTAAPAWMAYSGWVIVPSFQGTRTHVREQPWAPRPGEDGAG